jgi:4-hydroxy-2-oxoheptanedioate aldolase
MLQKDQPIYYTQTSGGGYEDGRRLAQTTADYITYEMEHGSFDISELRAFMQGLVDGGPAPTGHRTPAVIATLPVAGLDEPSMRANAWVVQQVLAAGVHGILLTHARDPEALRALIEASRYPFAPEAEGLSRGLRGAGSESFAARIWGVGGNEYLRLADPWPLNPDGELFIGAKIEDSVALENAERTTRVPGLAFAEWGPSDMEFWLLGRPEPGRNARDEPVMQAARTRVLQATRDAGIFFLDICNDRNVEAQIKDGVMICTGGARVGRAYTRRDSDVTP